MKGKLDIPVKETLEKYLLENHPEETLKGFVGCSENTLTKTLFGIFAANVRYIGITDTQLIIMPVTLVGEPKDDIDLVNLNEIVTYSHSKFFSQITIKYGNPVVKRSFSYNRYVHGKNATNLIEFLDKTSSLLDSRDLSGNNHSPKKGSNYKKSSLWFSWILIISSILMLLMGLPAAILGEGNGFDPDLFFGISMTCFLPSFVLLIFGLFIRKRALKKKMEMELPNPDLSKA